MKSKRTIKAQEIVSDIRSGMTNHNLMHKYHVSLDKLQNIFRQLLDAHAMERSELEPLLSIPHERLDIGKRRRLHRSYVFVKLPIFDLENLLDQGTIVDISEEGFQASEIPANMGDTKQFLVQADYFADVFPFVIEAKCLWSSKVEDRQWFAGFEITNISDQGLEQLRKLISMLTISE
jgi:hypothetical protein